MKSTNIHTSRQGKTVIKGRVMPSVNSDNNTHLGRADDEHSRSLDYEQPDIDPTIREIERETMALRYAGKLKPFNPKVTEKIGALPRLVRKPAVKKQSAEQLRKAYSEKQEEARAALVALRQKNDLILKELLG